MPAPPPSLLATSSSVVAEDAGRSSSSLELVPGRSSSSGRPESSGRSSGPGRSGRATGRGSGFGKGFDKGFGMGFGMEFGKEFGKVNNDGGGGGMDGSTFESVSVDLEASSPLIGSLLPVTRTLSSPAVLLGGVRDMSHVMSARVLRCRTDSGVEVPEQLRWRW